MEETTALALAGESSPEFVAAPASDHTPAPSARVLLHAPPAPIEPGTPVILTALVENASGEAGAFSVGVRGLPDPWVRVSRSLFTLGAGERTDVTIVLHPPRSAESLAGEHRFAVVVLTSASGTETAVEAAIEILPFDEFHLDLVSEDGAFRAAIENAGNRRLECRLGANDPSHRVACQVDKPHIELAAGERLTVPVRAVRSRRALFGRAGQRPFLVTATPSRGDPQTVTGGVFIRPPLRQWRYPAAVAATMAVAGLAWLSYGEIVGGDAGAAPVAASAVAGVAAPPTELPAATPAGMARGARAIAVNSPAGNCLSVRQYHTRQPADPRSKKVGELCDGDQVTLLSDRVDDEGYAWWNVDDGRGVTGWAAEKALSGGDVFLQPAP